MKRITLILLSLLTTFIFVSCNNATPPANDNQEQNVQEVRKKNPACAEIASSIIDSFSINVDEFDYYNFGEEEKKLDEMVISLFYGDMESGETPDFSHVTDYYVLIPVTTAATEIGVFKVNDAQNTKAMKQYFKNRASSRATTFAPYDEVESQKAKNVLISAYDEYVWYIITDINQDIEAKILEAVR